MTDGGCYNIMYLSVNRGIRDMDGMGYGLDFRTCCMYCEHADTVQNLWPKRCRYKKGPRIYIREIGNDDGILTTCYKWRVIQ